MSVSQRCTRRAIAALLLTVLAATVPAAEQAAKQEQRDPSRAEAAEDSSAAQAEPGDQAGVDVIRVVGTPPERYQTESSDALTGFDVPYLDLPRSVEVIPEQILLDRKVTTLTEALQNASGVSLSDGFGGTNDDFLIRGFRRNSVYRNGFRLGSNFRINTTNLERIEVIKGPASITLGQVEPGGAVNIETKKPLSEPRYYVEGRGARYDSYFGLLDLSQPIDAIDGGMRLNASIEEAESFRDFTDIDRDFLSLAVTTRPFDGTRLDFTYEYRDESRPLDRGTVTLSDGEGGRFIPDLPRSRRLGEPFETFDVELNIVELGLTQELGDDWTLEAGVFHEFSDADDFQARPLRVFPDGTLVRRADGSRNRDIDVTAGRLRLNGEFATGPLKHQLAVGIDYRESAEDRFFAAGETRSDFNIFDPEFGNLSPMPLVQIPASSDTREYGIYVQDYVDLSARLSALLGVRFDEAEVESFFGPPVNRDVDTGFKDAISPQAGLIYRLRDNVSVYASYAEGFLPNTRTDETTGRVFDPEVSEQFEAGVKTEFNDGRIQSGIAVFDIEKENVVRVVDGVAQLVEGQSSQGIEVTTTGRLLPGLNIIGNYAFIDAEIESGPNRGNRPRNVAKHTFNLWASYEVPAGPLHGLGGGAGVSVFGDRFGDDANTWSLGAYELVDASLWYNIALPRAGALNLGEARLQFSVKNLTDERFFPASGGDLRVTVGQPRTYIGSIAVTF